MSENQLALTIFGSVILFAVVTWFIWYVLYAIEKLKKGCGMDFLDTHYTPLKAIEQLERDISSNREGVRRDLFVFNKLAEELGYKYINGIDYPKYEKVKKKK